MITINDNLDAEKYPEQNPTNPWWNRESGYALGSMQHISWKISSLVASKISKRDNVVHAWKSRPRTATASTEWPLLSTICLMRAVIRKSMTVLTPEICARLNIAANTLALVRVTPVKTCQEADQHA